MNTNLTRQEGKIRGRKSKEETDGKVKGMINMKIRKGVALLCAMLMIGATACKSEPAEGKHPAEGNHTEASGEQGTNRQEGSNEEAGTSSVVAVTQAPKLREEIQAVKESLADERAERTAVVTLSDTGITISGSGCESDGSRLKIKEAGVYEIGGTLSDGSIYVNADNESEVHLIFNGVTIHNETNAAVYCKKASRVTITLAEGSVNTLSGGTDYVLEEGEDEPDATLYAKHDLVLNGTGKLVVTSAYGDAVKGKDSLYILGGTYEVTSAEDGIVGRDLLYVADGVFAVNAVADALKASNDTDAALGNMMIDGGSFTLTAGTDGMQAENTLMVNDGTFVIRTGGGAASASTKTDSFGFGGGRGWGDWGGWGQDTETATEDTASTKGLKAGTLLAVTGGRFELDTCDDALHGNADVTITGGDFTIATGDDGIHAEEKLLMEGTPNVRITKSYEGLEALEIVIGGGEIEITASDDGLNAAGGADGSGFGHPGMGMFGDGEGEVTINGGNITVNADGDGLDSNGNLTVNGGSITVFGPTDGGNGVLDYGGSFALNGGTLLAFGSSEMAQTPASSSGQYSVAAVLSSRVQAGSTVEIVVDGKTVFLREVPKQFNYIVASSGEFVSGAEVSVVVDGKECYAGTLEDTVTCFGFSGGMGGFGGGNKGGLDGREEPGGRGDKGGFGGGEAPWMPNGGAPELPERERPEFPNGEVLELPEGE